MVSFANYATLYKDIIEYFTNIANPARALKWYNKNDQQIIVRFINEGFKQKVISFNEYDKQRIVDFNYKADFSIINEHFKGGIQ